MTLLKPYLPGQTATPSYYAHGGSMMALGLIFQKTKDKVKFKYLVNLRVSLWLNQKCTK